MTRRWDKRSRKAQRKLRAQREERARAGQTTAAEVVHARSKRPKKRTRGHLDGPGPGRIEVLARCRTWTSRATTKRTRVTCGECRDVLGI